MTFRRVCIVLVIAAAAVTAFRSAVPAARTGRTAGRGHDTAVRNSDLVVDLYLV